jgi:hypothetical protein
MVPFGQPAEQGVPSFIGSVGLHIVGVVMSRTVMSGTAMSGPPPPCCASSLPQPPTATRAKSAAESQVMRMASSVLQKACPRRRGYICELASAAAVDFHLRSCSHCAVR